MADRVVGLHTNCYRLDDAKLVKMTGDARLGEVYIKPLGLKKIKSSKSNTKLVSKILEIKRVNFQEIDRWVSIQTGFKIEGNVKGAIKIINELKNVPTPDTLKEMIQRSGADTEPLSEIDRLQSRRYWAELKDKLRDPLFKAIEESLEPKDWKLFSVYMRTPKLLNDEYLVTRGWASVC